MEQYVNHTDARPVFLDEKPVEDTDFNLKYRNELISNVLSLDPTLGYNYRPDLVYDPQEEELPGAKFGWKTNRVMAATNPELVVLTTHIENAMNVLKSGGQL